MSIYALDYYHIKWFEMLADFLDLHLLDRVLLATRDSGSHDSTFFHDSESEYYLIRTRSMQPGCYPLDGGAERLIMEWKEKVKNLVNGRSKLDTRSKACLDFYRDASNLTSSEKDTLAIVHKAHSPAEDRDNPITNESSSLGTEEGTHALQSQYSKGKDVAPVLANTEELALDREAIAEAHQITSTCYKRQALPATPYKNQ